jgi:hypothetical protein
MAVIKVGDRVRIIDRSDWFLSKKYKLADAEGRVAEVIDEPKGYITVLLDKKITGIDTSIPLGFRLDAVEKI